MLCENMDFDEFSRGFADFRCVCEFFFAPSIAMFFEYSKLTEYPKCTGGIGQNLRFDPLIPTILHRMTKMYAPHSFSPYSIPLSKKNES